MPLQKPIIKWSAEAISDLKNIYYSLLTSREASTATLIRKELLNAPKSIVFSEQYQQDEIFPKFRRIIVRNYRILYVIENHSIYIVTIVNSLQN